MASQNAESTPVAIPPSARDQVAMAGERHRTVRVTSAGVVEYGLHPDSRDALGLATAGTSSGSSHERSGWLRQSDSKRAQVLDRADREAARRASGSTVWIARGYGLA